MNDEKEFNIEDYKDDSKVAYLVVRYNELADKQDEIKKMALADPEFKELANEDVERFQSEMSDIELEIQKKL